MASWAEMDCVRSINVRGATRAHSLRGAPPSNSSLAAACRCAFERRWLPAASVSHRYSVVAVTAALSVRDCELCLCVQLCSRGCAWESHVSVASPAHVHCHNVAVAPIHVTGNGNRKRFQKVGRACSPSCIRKVITNLDNLHCLVLSCPFLSSLVLSCRILDSLSCDFLFYSPAQAPPPPSPYLCVCVWRCGDLFRYTANKTWSARATQRPGVAHEWETYIICHV